MRQVRHSIASRCSSLISSLLNLVYPSCCPICKKSSDIFFYSPICKQCWNSISKYTGPSCKICAAPLASEYAGVCSECLSEPPAFSKVLNFGIYAGALAEAIHLMKFYNIRRLAEPFAGFLMQLDIPKCDAIVPVPLSRKALIHREFNQTLLIARRVSKNLRIPLFMDTLHKTKDTLPQVGLNAKERLGNLRRAFKAEGNIKGLTILLLDDVMTTGATLRECAKALRKAGAKETIALTLARSSMM